MKRATQCKRSGKDGFECASVYELHCLCYLYGIHLGQYPVCRISPTPLSALVWRLFFLHVQSVGDARNATAHSLTRLVLVQPDVCGLVRRFADFFLYYDRRMDQVHAHNTLAGHFGYLINQ